MKQSKTKKTKPISVQQYVKRLESLIDASQILNSTFELGELLKLILSLATKNLSAERGTIYLIDEEKNELWSRVAQGDEMVEIRLPVGTGIAGSVAKTGKTINLEDVSKDKRFFAGIDKKSGFKTKTMLCMPMKNRNGKIIGVFQIMNKKRGVFLKEDALFLEAFSDHAALAIENSILVQTSLENERVKKELMIAANIQQRIIPKELPVIPGYEIAAEAVPCKSIGGDFYDFIPLDEHLYAIVIADVSGKGIPAALLVSTLHASLRAYIQSDHNLVSLVSKLNNTVCANSTADSFITFFIMLLDNRSHTVNYLNAGHNPPLHVHASELIELAAETIPLGMMEDAEGKLRTIQLQPNDEIVLYTDGVTEAMNTEQKPYGDDLFRMKVREGKDLPAGASYDAIRNDVQRYVGKEPASDDLTLMIVKRLPS